MKKKAFKARGKVSFLLALLLASFILSFALSESSGRGLTLASPPEAAPQTPDAKPAVPPTGLKVFLARGKDAVSDLDEKGYIDKMKQGALKGQTVTAHVGTENKADFLRTFAESDIVYVSAHSRKVDELESVVIGSGESVLPSDISRAIRESGKPGPSLFVVAGCSTLDREDVNMATAMGIREGTKGKVYIGWKGKVLGSLIDRSFPLFWKAFLEPDENGRYRTVEEAKKWVLKNGAPAAWGSFEIVGDGSLRATDIFKAPAVSLAKGVWVQTGSWRFHRATWAPDIKGAVEFIGYTAKATSALGTSTHEWTIPPKQLVPGDLLTLDLKVGKADGVFTRAYTLVFFGRPSKAASGMGFGVIMIPPSMDWAGTEADSGPLFSHRPLPMSIVRDDREFVLDVTLEGGKYLTGSGNVEGPWSGRIPDAAAGNKLYLIISSGHAGRGVQVETLSMTIDSTCSVAGAMYYEYTWRGN
jgi:hypothetical protein